jgi:zinc protease
MLLLSLMGCPKQAPETAAVATEPVMTGDFEPIVMPVQGSPIVYLQATCKAGSAYDPEGKEGLAWVTARLMRDGGAGEASAELVQGQLFSMGADIEVVADKDLVTFRGKALVDDVDTLMPLFTDVLTRPTLDEGVFYRVVDEAREGVTSGLMASDELLGDAALDKAIFEGGPYAHPVQGLDAALQGISLEDVQAFHGSAYTRSSCVYGIGGAVTDKLVQDFIIQMLGLPEGERRPAPQAMAALPEGRDILVVEKTTGSTGAHFGHAIDVGRGDEDYAALLLATTAFGAHRESYGRLFREIRTERALNYGDYAYAEHYVDLDTRDANRQVGTLRAQPHFYVWVRPVETDQASFAVRMALKMTEDFVTEGLTEDEFEQTRTHLQKRMKLWAKDPGRRLGYALEAAALGVPNLLETLDEDLDELTLEQVNAAVLEHVHPETMDIVLVSGDGAKFAAELLKVYETPMVYKTAAPNSEQANEDKVYATYQVGEKSWSVIQSDKVFE